MQDQGLDHCRVERNAIPRILDLDVPDLAVNDAPLDRQRPSRETEIPPLKCNDLADLTPVNHLVGYSELLAESCEDAGDESGHARSRSLFRLAKQIQAAIDEAFAKGTVFTPGFLGELA